LYLTYQSATDSRLFDISVYRLVLRRLFGYRRSQKAPVA
jgi:hypothetical protein